MSGSPLRLLRHDGPIEPYPLEPSNAELAAEAGIPVEEIVRFDMNTLGGGPLPGVVEAWRAWDPAEAVEYGDLAYRRLRAAISAAIGVAPHRIVPGAGADELIRLVTIHVVGPGDAVVVPTPTFPMFAVEAGLAGARIVTVPREHPSRRQTVAELRAAAAGARLVWTCSPNNPTGDLMPVDEVRELAAGLEAIVVVVSETGTAARRKTPPPWTVPPLAPGPPEASARLLAIVTPVTATGCSGPLSAKRPLP